MPEFHDRRTGRKYEVAMPLGLKRVINQIERGHGPGNSNKYNSLVEKFEAEDKKRETVNTRKALKGAATRVRIANQKENLKK